MVRSWSEIDSAACDPRARVARDQRALAVDGRRARLGVVALAEVILVFMDDK